MKQQSQERWNHECKSWRSPTRFAADIQQCLFFQAMKAQKHCLKSSMMSLLPWSSIVALFSAKNYGPRIYGPFEFPATAAFGSILEGWAVLFFIRSAGPAFLSRKTRDATPAIFAARHIRSPVRPAAPFFFEAKKLAEASMACWSNLQFTGFGGAVTHQAFRTAMHLLLLIGWFLCTLFRACLSSGQCWSVRTGLGSIRKICSEGGNHFQEHKNHPKTDHLAHKEWSTAGYGRIALSKLQRTSQNMPIRHTTNIHQPSIATTSLWWHFPPHRLDHFGPPSWVTHRGSGQRTRRPRFGYQWKTHKTGPFLAVFI